MDATATATATTEGEGTGRRAGLEVIITPPSAVTLRTLIGVYLEDYEVRQFRTLDTARGRVAHLVAFFGEGRPVQEIAALMIRQYQMARQREGAAAATINRETSALSRMFRLAVQWGWLASIPTFPGRLRESPPRQGFFEHREYLAVRAHLPAAYKDVLDFAYYSGWRKHEILDLTWDEVDLLGGVIRLSPGRSKTQVGRLLPISPPLAAVLKRRKAKRRGKDGMVFSRDGVTVRAWRRAWPDACRLAGVPGRIIHDCRRTAARNLIRAGVPERVAMTLTGHKTRSIFDRYNIVNERELFSAGEQLVAYLRAKGGRNGKSKAIGASSAPNGRSACGRGSSERPGARAHGLPGAQRTAVV